MTFYEEIKELEKNTFEKWFKEWIHDYRLKDRIKEAVKEGYSSVTIDFDRYGQGLIRRKDPILLEKFKEYLGNGFKISYFNSIGSDNILISW